MSHPSLLRVAAATLAPAARALPPECPLLFPDLRCGRHGRYAGFVPPMMHPYLFEDPFITTGINAVGIWHEFPGDSILDGGDLWAAALQARGALLGEDPEEGYDYANLGSPSMAGHTVVAGALGVRVPIHRHVIFGAAWEVPLSPSRDVLRQRASAQLTIEF
jgi:hypothetical protein